MKAYKIEVLVIDFEDIGKDEIVCSLENARYVNAQVKDVKCVDIGDWHDEHPLNSGENSDAEYQRLFN